VICWEIDPVTMQNTFGVVWREGTDKMARGRLELLPRSLRLDGIAGSLPVDREVRYADLDRVHVGRAPQDRIHGRPSLLIEPRNGGTISIASVAGAGVIGELADRLAALQHGGGGRRTVVVLPLKPGTRSAVETLLAAGPPFDPSDAGLDRHEVFVTADEVVFLFESPYGVEPLLAQAELWERAVVWQEHLAGPPRIASEAYSWMREDAEIDRFLVPSGLHS
jgi:hypothetical protein